MLVGEHALVPLHLAARGSGFQGGPVGRVRGGAALVRGLAGDVAEGLANEGPGRAPAPVVQHRRLQYVLGRRHQVTHAVGDVAGSPVVVGADQIGRVAADSAAATLSAGRIRDDRSSFGSVSVGVFSVDFDGQSSSEPSPPCCGKVLPHCPCNGVVGAQRPHLLIQKPRRPVRSGPS
ncbi:hypothetical protein GCM10010182_62870 [Actinomadura cremea]|nr:hypothetical protein GCM10010182_62870 [Actinomadura cremea]